VSFIWLVSEARSTLLLRGHVLDLKNGGPARSVTNLHYVDRKAFMFLATNGARGISVTRRRNPWEVFTFAHHVTESHGGSFVSGDMTPCSETARARIAISRAELRDGDVVIVGEPDCCSLQVRLG
jgi:hypothetical protein